MILKRRDNSNELNQLLFLSLSHRLYYFGKVGRIFKNFDLRLSVALDNLSHSCQPNLSFIQLLATS